MAIKLKEKPRAILHPEFWDAVLLFTDEIGLSLVTAIRGAKNQRHAKQLAAEYSQILANMKLARNRDPKLETTLLHSPWDEITSNPLGELVFIKNNVIIRPLSRRDTDNHRNNKSYEAGRYKCIVKRDAFHVNAPKQNRIFLTAARE